MELINVVDITNESNKGSVNGIKKGMKEWMDKYYPMDAGEMAYSFYNSGVSELDMYTKAMSYSLLKWYGLTEEGMEWYDIEFEYLYGYVGIIDGECCLPTDDSSCVLCQLGDVLVDNGIAHDTCHKCPLGNCGKEYGEYFDEGNATPMHIKLGNTLFLMLLNSMDELNTDTIELAISVLLTTGYEMEANFLYRNLKEYLP